MIPMEQQLLELQFRQTALDLAIRCRDQNENTGVTITRSKKFLAFLKGESKDKDE